jgi:superfamily II DNA or RNA helicase
VNVVTALTQDLLAKLAGWEVVQEARSLLASGRVVDSDWQPPRLLGTVREGTGTHRAGLVIRSATDADNVCPCRASRQRGLICAHSVAVGLHRIRIQTPLPPPVEPKPVQSAKPTTRSGVKPLRRAVAGEAGETLELHLILPPNLVEAASRGRAMVCFEASWDGGRSPLNAVPRDTAFQLDERDAVLLDAVEALTGGEAPGMILLNPDQLTQLLPLMVGHPRVTVGKSQSINIAGDPVRVALRATLDSDGNVLLRTIGPAPAGLIGRATPWVFQNQAFRPLGLPPGLHGLLTEPIRIPRDRVPTFLMTDWPEVVVRCEVQPGFALEDFTLEPGLPSFRLHLSGGLAMLQARLDCFYEEKRVVPGKVTENDAAWLADPRCPTRFVTRNLDAEKAAVARLLRHGFSGPDAEGCYHLNGQDTVLSFFARDHPRLEREWEVTLEERLDQSTQQLVERIEPRFRITSSGEQWFDLEVSYQTAGGERFTAADIQRLLLSGRSHARLKSGKFALLDTGAVEELQEVLLDSAPQQHAAGYRLHHAQAGFIDAALRVQPGWQVDVPDTWASRAAQQRGEVQLDAPPLGPLEDVLRPYQKTGVAWLEFLRANAFGGILADEMGLGKTLQVLALLDVLRARGDLVAPALIVCPTSLVFNWAAEAARFTPDLRVLILHGPQRRDRFDAISGHHLVITSYALLRRDAAGYGDVEFDTVVLDEAQHIKNRQTQNAQTVKAVRSRNRLVLTGTPIENSVLDLWSIFDFLMPGYLGSAGDFRERYEVAIGRDHDAVAQDRLNRRLRPFLLRRLKRDVASDLPDRIEQVSYCDLNESQCATYRQVLEASRNELYRSVDANGLARSRMLVLTTLLRLRQICCDLRLLKTGAEDPAADVPTSGKVELFAELLEEVLDGGHRVLVFSQFTSMLGLLRDHLTSQQIDFCYLDGATRDRSRVIDQFQSNSAIPVFLISLKAGGVGLNLTAADTVIHFDPWWNPAVEAQATDRAHRIGQERVVTSYKLITRDTVEEKILHLQNRKRALIRETLGGEEQLSETLSWEEIQELLAG